MSIRVKNFLCYAPISGRHMPEMTISRAFRSYDMARLSIFPSFAKAKLFSLLVCFVLAAFLCVSLGAAAFAKSDRWMGCRGADIDARIGGRFRVSFSTDAEYYEVGGVYREVVEPERLVFTWAWEKDGGEPDFGEVEPTEAQAAFGVLERPQSPSRPRVEREHLLGSDALGNRTKDDEDDGGALAAGPKRTSPER